MTTMASSLEQLTGDRKLGAFKPSARYDIPLDCLVYLTEDVAYRADRVDGFLTVLWHPEQNKLVGIKLKWFHFIFRCMKDLLKLKDSQFPSFARVLEFVIAGGWGRAMMVEQEDKRKHLLERYAAVWAWAGKVKIEIPAEAFAEGRK